MEATNGTFTVLKIGSDNVSTKLAEKESILNNTTDLTIKNLTATTIEIGANDVNSKINQKHNTIPSTSTL